MTQHTPGPWEINKRAFSPGIDIIKYGECMIATIGDAGYASCSEANARLIAAAPELLAALENLAGTASNLLAEAESDPTCAMVAVDMQDLGRLDEAHDKACAVLDHIAEPGG